MTAALKNVELAGAQQALFTGQVVNALTGAGLTQYALELVMRLPGETAFRPLPCQLVKSSAGYFAASGVAVQALPQQLDPGDLIEFRFIVASPGFSEQQITANVSAASITATETASTLAGHEVTLQIINAPVLHQIIALQPVAVGLQGMTIEDNDPSAPLNGVSVQVIEPVILPPVVSDTQGRFRIPSLPIAHSVVLHVVLGGESFNITHHIDYNSPLNTRMISLNG